MAGNTVQPRRTVTSKVTAILLAFAEGDVHNLSELSRRTGLPLSTTHRLVGELAEVRLLERTTDGYRVGLPLRAIGATPIPRVPTLTEHAVHALDDLAAVTGSRVRLGVLRGTRVGYLERTPDRTTSTGAGLRAELPAHATALGKALLAYAGPDAVRGVLAAGLTRFTRHTLTRPELLRHALSEVRRIGLARCAGELEPGVHTAAVPVFGPGGAVPAALEIRLGAGAAAADRAPQLLTVAARSLSRQLLSREVAAPEPARIA